jgi:hypothetical protein
MAKSVFISSTSLDLRDHRAAVKQVIERLEMRPIDMANFGSRPGDAVDVSLDQVHVADYFVGIVAHRYGYVIEGTVKSVTEQEYDEAVRRRIPRLMYLVDPNYAWPSKFIEKDAAVQERLSRFKARIEKETVRSLFTSPENLSQQVATDLARLVQIRRRRSLILRIVIGISAVLFSILAFAAAVLMADEGVRSDIIELAGLASKTPALTAAPTPFPERMPIGFNVVVAGFGFEQEDGSVVQNGTADDICDVVYAAVAEIPEVDHIMGWRDYGVGHILSQDPAERKALAERMAEVLGGRSI